ncbi:HNH endonuclease [Rahnella aceris]|uniref:HNH endonuclease n=1 Tax=Rahnella sp. (strain Y9602) TaxID=2703885 RepID=UPI001C263FC4|nr:HNH endonuclease [Rahnella aceris]MBU9866806.1 HNH endonuclease [Rahnella aceris]
MPPRTPTPCRARTCRALVSDRSGYCDAHRGESWSRHNKKASSTQRGYGAKWRRQREAALRRDRGLCLMCLAEGVATQATDVDHIIPRAHGGGDELENLQSLCTPHHRHKTARERLKKPNPKPV